MPTPLQDRAYELLLRVVTMPIDYEGNNRVKAVAEALFVDSMDVAVALEQALSSANRTDFVACLNTAHTKLKKLKLWLRVLDDVGRIMPESVAPLHDTAEEVHRLLLAAIRTSKNNVNTLHQVRASIPSPNL